MFSKACEYGIKAAIYITQNSLINNRVSLKEIAAEIDSPVAFTAKILQDLARNKVVTSIKGAHGGFEIHNPEQLKLSQIVTAIDSDDIYKGCGLGLIKCDELNPCPIHDKFKVVRENLKVMLENTTLKELAQKLEDGTTVLKI
jgi:Rrf2 family protein